ncbi:VTT domain-containing protein [Myxococcota bacterium]|nr:VTT domain-containing protein [Myxococcota bacterium]
MGEVESDQAEQGVVKDRRGRLQRAKRILAVVAAAICVGLALYSYRSGELTLDPQQLRAQIQDLGWLAPAGFVFAAALRPVLLLPSWVIMATGGLLFGTLGGFVWGTLAFTLGGAIAFGIARGLGRDFVAQRESGRFAAVDAYLVERGPVVLAFYTALPVTILTPVHAACGLSGMRASHFVLAILAGFAPRTALYSLFGDALARGDATRIIVIGAILAVSLGVGIVLVRRMRRAAATREAQRADDPPSSVSR